MNFFVDNSSKKMFQSASTAGFAIFLFYILPYVFSYYFGEQIGLLFASLTFEEQLFFDGALQIGFLLISVGLACFIFKFDFFSIFKLRGITKDEDNPYIFNKGSSIAIFLFFGLPIMYFLNLASGTISQQITALFEGGGIYVPEVDISVQNTSTYHMALYLVRISVMAPLIEEILIRGIVLKALLPFGSKIAIFVSALMFGLVHGNIGQAVAALVIGIAFGYITVKTKSIYPAIILHAINNLIAGLGSYFIISESMSVPSTIYVFVTFTLIVSGGIFFLGGAITYIVKKLLKKNSSLFIYETNSEPLSKRLTFVMLNPFIVLYFVFNIAMFIYSFFLIN